jgi:hypothetical protein
MLLAFNENKKISSLTIAIIIISLSFLPLNDGGDGGHSSALLLFHTEPVFAQLSGQSISYGEEQVGTRPSSPSSSSSAMDFGLFMDGFANSIFNGTSTFAAVGTSIVDGVEVSGISLDKSQNKVSVTLNGTATQVGGGGNNNITSTDTTITPLSSIPNSNSVSIIAMRIPISPSDILSIAAASSSSPSSLTAQDDEIGDNITTESQINSFPSDSFNPFSLLSSLQIGSSTLIDVGGWLEPQTVTMDLVGSDTANQEQEQQINSANATMAEIVLVSVIPYTGIGNNTTSSTT